MLVPQHSTAHRDGLRIEVAIVTDTEVQTEPFEHRTDITGANQAVPVLVERAVHAQKVPRLQKLRCTDR